MQRRPLTFPLWEGASPSHHIRKGRKMLELDLPGMTCGGCVRGVTAAVQELDPGALVEADLEQRRARITTTAPEAQVRAVLTEAGYMG